MDTKRGGSGGQVKIPAAVLAGICVLVVVAMLCLCPIFTRIDGPPPKVKCVSNLKQIGEAFKMYCNDHDGYWPLAENWCDALKPYAKNVGMFHCPNLKDEKGGYAYNASLSGVADEDISSPDLVPAAFDARPGWNLAGGAELAVTRHPEGINVVFADGHTEGLTGVGRLQWEPVQDEEPNADDMRTNE